MEHDEIIEIRKDFHRYPELAFREYRTCQKIKSFFEGVKPDYKYQVGQTGLIFIFDSKKAGPKLAFRAEMDALPIQEKNEKLIHQSHHKGVSHVCGHDGHMSIVMKLAAYVSKNRPRRGKVVFIFQPAEETGEGANDLISSEIYKSISPDFVFGLHNIPGKKKHQVLIKKGSFAAGSKGMSVFFSGKTAHAAEPENGTNPIYCISHLVQNIEAKALDSHLYKNKVLATIIHVKLGEKAFGTSPGYGELHLTLRAFEPGDLENLTVNIENLISEASNNHDLGHSIQYQESFPVLVNDESCVELIKNAALGSGLEVKNLDAPFKWSEDFSFYGQDSKIGFFGLGSGKDQPPLHNHAFDFPDEIIESGFDVFRGIFQEICK